MIATPHGPCRRQQPGPALALSWPPPPARERRHATAYGVVTVTVSPETLIVSPAALR
jgi:hypothetical protein